MCGIVGVDVRAGDSRRVDANDPSPSCRSCTTRESGDDEEGQSDDHDPRQGVDKLAWVKCGRVAISAGANVDASQFRAQMWTRRNFGLN